MSLFKTTLFVSVLSTLSLAAFNSSAEVKSSAFSTKYAGVAPVAENQAQIIYYRLAGDDNKNAAHVYVDGEYQAALLPGGYTNFCVNSGSHSLGAYIGDAPQYNGKTSQAYRDILAGGKNYFVKVGNGKDGKPVLVSRQQAEQELAGALKQVHTLSRASSVQACQFTGSASKDYVLSGDVLFPFGKSHRRDITDEGRQQISTLSNQISKDNPQPLQITVVGHTDAVGTPKSNHKLGLARANSVKALLVEEGIAARAITATSAGSREPVVAQCSGSKAEQQACNAPNRRVVISVNTASN